MMPNEDINRKDNVTGRFFNHYLPYWPVFLALLILTIGASWFYLKDTAPLYESTARILISDEKKGAENAKELEQLDPLSSNKVIENEMEIIQSRTLMNQVATNLNLYSPIYKEARFRDRAAYMTAPVEVQVMDPDKIHAEKKIPIRAENGQVWLAEVEYPLGQWVNTPYGMLKFTHNPHFAPGQAENDITRPPAEGSGKENFYLSLDDPKQVVASLEHRLKVTTEDKLSSILDLKLEDEVPQRGDDILNELMNVYSGAIIKNKSELAANTMAFVDDQLKGVRRELDSIERINQQYKSNEGAVDVKEQSRLYLQNVSSNDEKISDINMQLSILREIQKSVGNSDGSTGMIASVGGIHDPLLSDLLNKLYSEELKYEGLKKTTAENNPEMLAIAEQIDRMKPSVLENIQSQEASLKASKRDLEGTNSNYSAALQNIPGKERSLTDIGREQEVKSSIYSFLLQKKEETAISYASNASDVRIVDKAESAADPVSPKKKVVYICALLFALIGGMGTVAAKESMTRKIMFRHEIETITDLPILAEISHQSARDPILIRLGQRSAIAEQFRKLRASLKSIGIHAQKKRILMTSAIAGEGKSFVAANLATVIALSGKKVVLLDCDLHNPSLDAKLNKQGAPGITQYLQGQADAQEILQPASSDGCFFFISSGNLPENPSELLMNGKIEDLLDQLDGLFDYIILDTPPVMPITDAYILSPYCDATLLVVRHKYTPKIFLQRVDQDSKMNQLTNTAIVFNGIRPRGFGSENYGYGYGYVYKHKLSGGNRRIARLANPITAQEKQ